MNDLHTIHDPFRVKRWGVQPENDTVINLIVRDPLQPLHYHHPRNHFLSGLGAKFDPESNGVNDRHNHRLHVGRIRRDPPGTSDSVGVGPRRGRFILDDLPLPRQRSSVSLRLPVSPVRLGGSGGNTDTLPSQREPQVRPKTVVSTHNEDWRVVCTRLLSLSLRQRSHIWLLLLYKIQERHWFTETDTVVLCPLIKRF